jgi:hypothetical protein
VVIHGDTLSPPSLRHGEGSAIGRSTRESRRSLQRPALCSRDAHQRYPRKPTQLFLARLCEHRGQCGPTIQRREQAPVVILDDLVQNADIATIADKLDVTHVLEGSVRKSGERMRITAQLVDGATSEHIWSQIYDRDVRDIFGVQTDIATSVAEARAVQAWL